MHTLQVFRTGRNGKLSKKPSFHQNLHEYFSLNSKFRSEPHSLERLCRCSIKASAILFRSTIKLKMARCPPKNHLSGFKAKVGLAAVTGDRTLVVLAEQFDVHPNHTE